jgi:hypothetical protein
MLLPPFTRQNYVTSAPNVASMTSGHMTRSISGTVGIGNVRKEAFATRFGNLYPHCSEASRSFHECHDFTVHFSASHVAWQKLPQRLSPGPHACVHAIAMRYKLLSRIEYFCHALDPTHGDEINVPSILLWRSHFQIRRVGCGILVLCSTSGYLAYFS